jgi:hypothetical protein
MSARGCSNVGLQSGFCDRLRGEEPVAQSPEFDMLCSFVETPGRAKLRRGFVIGRDSPRLGCARGWSSFEIRARSFA